MIYRFRPLIGVSYANITTWGEFATWVFIVSVPLSGLSYANLGSKNSCCAIGFWFPSPYRGYLMQTSYEDIPYAHFESFRPLIGGIFCKRKSHWVVNGGIDLFPSPYRGYLMQTTSAISPLYLTISDTFPSPYRGYLMQTDMVASKTSPTLKEFPSPYRGYLMQTISRLYRSLHELSTLVSVPLSGVSYANGYELCDNIKFSNSVSVPLSGVSYANDLRFLTEEPVNS